MSGAKVTIDPRKRCAKEIKFVYQLLQSIGIKIELPITVRVDNIGAIFMSENTAISQKTKHVGTRF